MTLTPSQEKLEDLLGDGEPHLMEQLIQGMDEFMEVLTFQMHVSNLRKKLRADGKDLISYRLWIANTNKMVYQIVQASLV